MKEAPQKGPIRLRAGQAFGLSVVLLTAAAGGMLAWHVSRTVHAEAGNPLGELLGSFGPAALFASGKGMILPLNGMPPGLEDFLQERAASFDPSQIPETYTGPHVFGSYADTFTLTHWLLFYTVGWTWRLFGISINALHLLTGVMGGFAAAALYLLFRLGMGRLFSFLGSLLTMMLPPFLLVEPSLRDFSKAPFFFLFIAATGMLLSRKSRPARLVLWAAGLGLLLGSGYGFRQDLLICLPVALVVLLAAPLRNGYLPFLRAASVVVLLATFALPAAPVFRGVRHESGSVTTHTLFQGLSREAEQAMHFGGASYDLLLTPSDPETHAVVNVHARMRGMTEPMPLYLSPAYAKAGRALFKEWAAVFPADLFARGIASAESVLRLASVTLEYPGYKEIQRKLEAAHPPDWHHRYTRFIEPLGPVLLLGALLLIGIRGPALALAALFILGYFMAYPSLLFQIRHAFHLAFVIPWAALFLLENFLATLLCPLSARMRERFFRRAGSFSLASRALGRTAAALAVPVIVCALGLAALRYWQAHRVDEMMETYRAAAKAPVETAAMDDGDLCVITPVRPLPGLEESWNLHVGDAAASYIALAFEQADFAFPVQIRYQQDRGPYLTREFIVPAGGTGAGETLYVFPVFEMADFLPEEFLLVKHRFDNTPLANLLVHARGTNKFEGIGLRKDTAHLLKKVYHLQGHDALPWLLYLRLDPDPGRFRAFKRFGWEKDMLRLPAEIRYWRTGDAARAVGEYLGLLSRYPEHQPCLDRALTLTSRLEDPESRADALFRLGGYAMNRGGWFAAALADLAAGLDASGSPEKAERVYRRAIALAPGDMWHQVHLADMLLKQGDADTALGLYARVLEAAPESPYSAQQLDKAALQLGREEFVTRFWTSLHEERPEAVVPALHLAQDFERRELPDEAATLYEAILRIHDQHPETLLRQGILTALRQGYTTGRKLMDQALGLAPELKPLYVAGLNRIAQESVRTGAASFAEAIYRDIITLEPEDLQYTVNLADALVANGELEEAAHQYKTVLEKAPESPYCADRLDALLMTSGSVEPRVQYWDELCRLHPDASIPWLYLGIALEDAARPEDANTAYERALQNDPANGPAALRRGALSVVRGSRETGLALVRRAAESEPRLRPDAAKALAALAERDRTEGRVEDAEALYLEAIKLAPEELWHQVHLGELYLSQGRADEALGCFQKVIAAVPDSPHTAELIDQAYHLKQDVEGRVEYWRSVAVTHPGAARPVFHLGLALEAAGSAKEAAEAYQQALRIHPELEQAKTALQEVTPSDTGAASGPP